MPPRVLVRFLGLFSSLAPDAPKYFVVRVERRYGTKVDIKQLYYVCLATLLTLDLYYSK